MSQSLRKNMVATATQILPHSPSPTVLLFPGNYWTMKLLSIETSCDETAIAILNCAGDERAATFHVLGNALHSQIDIHREYGGVYPAIAKRAHAANLAPLLVAALEEAGMY